MARMGCRNCSSDAVLPKPASGPRRKGIDNQRRLTIRLEDDVQRTPADVRHPDLSPARGIADDLTELDHVAHVLLIDPALAHALQRFVREPNVPDADLRW